MQSSPIGGVRSSSPIIGLQHQQQQQQQHQQHSGGRGRCRLILATTPLVIHRSFAFARAARLQQNLAEENG